MFIFENFKYIFNYVFSVEDFNIGNDEIYLFIVFLYILNCYN